jgi:DHA1 family multidrug resistance protein-like MFS transporter
MKKCLIILFFCLFVVMIGYGLTLPVLPFYIERLALAEGATVSEASFQVGVLTGIFALMQFFFAPLWGKWSDQLGRRPLFSMGLGGYAISMFLFGMGTNLAMLYAARILGGILSAAVLPMANAYVADVTSEKDRGRGMAWLGSAISLGIVVGPALGAFLSQLDLHLTYRFAHFSIDGFSVPFFAAGLLSLLTLAAAMGWLPESLEPQCVELPGQRAHVETTLNLKSTRWFVPGWLGPFLVLAFLNQFALATFEGTFALHAQHVRIRHGCSTGSCGGLAYRTSRRENVITAGICFDGRGVGAVDDHSNDGFHSVICRAVCPWRVFNQSEFSGAGVQARR